MPVYEEKLLCPLAIRFTQSHIRSVFRDGREIEASRAEIGAVPGSGNYDVVLEAPFPSIEIVRWAPGQRSQSGGRCASRSDGQSEADWDSGSDDPDDERWFTYDNRRLYCLQQAALAHWPKRVAAVVQVMYTSNRSMLKRKFDSPSLGREVDIMRAGEDTPYTTFSWRRAATLSAPRLAAAAAALDAAAADEERGSVAELEGAPQAPSGLERMLLALAQEERQLEERRARVQQAAQAAPAGASGAGVGAGVGARDAACDAAPSRGGPRARRFHNRGGRAALVAAASHCVSVAA